MIVYWSLFLTVILIQLLPTTSRKGALIKLTLGFILIFIYAAIRVDFGLDYEEYELQFNYIKNLPNLSNIDTEFEMGYVLLNRFLPSHRILIILLSAFSVYTYYHLFRRYIPTKHYWLAFFLMMFCNNYMLFFQLSGLRNAITINIFCFSLFFIKERKLLSYAALCVLAFYFHKSSVFIMPLAYFIATPQEIKKVSLIIWSSIALILTIASTSNLLSLIEPFITTYFEKYSLYTEIAANTEDNKGILLYSFSFLMISINLFVLFKYTFSKYQIVILKLSTLFFITLLLGALNFRMSQYLAPFIIIGSIIIINAKVNFYLKYIYFFSMMIFLLYNFLVVFMQSEYFTYDNYNSIFSIQYLQNNPGN